MSSLSERPQNKSFGRHAGAPTSQRRSRERKEAYSAQPKHCLACGAVIPYEQKKNIFCDSSCAASYNNRNRSEESKKKRKETWQSKPTAKGEYCRVTFSLCKNCGNFFVVKLGSAGLCKNCRELAKKKIKCYRRLCKFDFTIKDYPELFDELLIEKYGWYSPDNSFKPNPGGLVFDHLYRIVDGFKNGIPIEIIKHPANAELVPQSVNHARRCNSIITIEILYERIRLWGEGVRNLPRFYTCEDK